MIATREKPIFTAYNNHAKPCGNPPFFTTRDKQHTYCGYFQNKYGEQFVFTFDREKEEGTLWGGDCGWKTQMPVVEVTALQFAQQAHPDLPSVLPLGNDKYLCVPGVKLMPEELTWLGACWAAAKGLT